MKEEVRNRIISERSKQHKDYLTEQLSSYVDLKLVKSPIEEILLYALASGRWPYWTPLFETSSCQDSVSIHELGYKYSRIGNTDREVGQYSMQMKGVIIVPQYPIGKFLTDFAIFVGDAEGFGKIAIECDGHDFHEKTKEQVARDKSRDRFFASKGWKLLRFSGSEIYKDPTKVADEVMAFVGDVYFHDVTGQPRI